MTPYFFGYGSLVNRSTHTYGPAYPARIPGWRREWRHVEGRSVAFLTAVPSEDDEISGLIAIVPQGNWAALDAREHSYDRVPAIGVNHGQPGILDIQIFHAPPGKHKEADRLHPILLSYIDVVVQGFNREFGRNGVENFFKSTVGWDAPILNDRANPIYPRAQLLTEAETAMADDFLSELGVKIVLDRPANFLP